MKKNDLLLTVFLALFMIGFHPALMGQAEYRGYTWNYVADPGFKLQLQRSNPSNYHMIYYRDFVSGKEEYYNLCKFMFTGDKSNYSDAIYKFILTGDENSARSEMKIEYAGYRENGIYQMEGEMRFTVANPGPAHVCQVWQNMTRSGNKILIYNTKTDNNGTLYVPSSQDRVGTFNQLKNVYAAYNNENNNWLKVNVIHNRETREILIYLNDSLYNKYIHYQAEGDYYFKFGAYGKPSGIGEQECIVEWRNMKFFEAALIKSEQPAAPENFRASSATPSEITLTWTGNSMLEDFYRIEQSEDSLIFTPVDTIPSGMTHYLKTGLEAGTPYYFRIMAVNDIGTSEYVYASERTFSENVLIVNDDEKGTSFNQFNFTGSWNVVSGQSGNNNDDFTESQVANSQFSLSFSGKKIHVFAKKKADSGTAGFSVDGNQMTAVGFYAPEEIKRAKVWSSANLAPGNHTLNMLVLEHKLCRIDYVVIEPHDPEVSSGIIARSPPEFKAYPNPAKNMLRVEYLVQEGGNTELSLFSMTGQKVRTFVDGYESPGKKNVLLHLGDLKSGSYLISLSSSKEKLLYRLSIK